MTSGRLGMKVWRATVRYARDLSGCVSRQEVQQDSIPRFGCHVNRFFLSPLSRSYSSLSIITKYRRFRSDTQSQQRQSTTNIPRITSLKFAFDFSIIMMIPVFSLSTLGSYALSRAVAQQLLEAQVSATVGGLRIAPSSVNWHCTH